MTKTTEDAALARKLDAIARNMPSSEPADIAAVVETVLESLSGDMTLLDIKLYAELQGLADYIQSAKREIAALKPQDIRERDIPLATDELDAVVVATAEATGAILDAAEAIERIASGMPGETRTEIGAIVTRIYEASNFQDVTGQRITKVVRALKHIEQRIDALLQAFGDGAAAPRGSGEAPAADADPLLLHGPQLPAEANKQDDIDAIFANSK